MADVYSDHYWQSEFNITEADLNRLGSFIKDANQAQDLTTLVKRVIRGRLRYGREVSPAAIGIRTTFTNFAS
jgi:hypothetical protein